jgi:dienelactone hydrolase
VFGHSFGGAQAAQFCSQDTRCKAGINIDGRPFGTVITNGVPVPFMFLLSDHGTPKDVVSQRILSQIQAIYDRQPHESRLRIVIRGAHHFTFSDDGALLKSAVFRECYVSLRPADQWPPASGGHRFCCTHVLR